MVDQKLEEQPIVKSLLEHDLPDLTQQQKDLVSLTYHWEKAVTQCDVIQVVEFCSEYLCQWENFVIVYDAENAQVVTIVTSILRSYIGTRMESQSFKAYLAQPESHRA